MATLVINQVKNINKKDFDISIDVLRDFLYRLTLFQRSKRARLFNLLNLIISYQSKDYSFYWSQGKLAKHFGVSIRTIGRDIEILESSFLIKVHRRWHCSNRYEIPDYMCTSEAINALSEYLPDLIKLDDSENNWQFLCEYGKHTIIPKKQKVRPIATDQEKDSIIANFLASLAHVPEPPPKPPVRYW